MPRVRPLAITAPKSAAKWKRLFSTGFEMEPMGKGSEIEVLFGCGDMSPQKGMLLLAQMAFFFRLTAAAGASPPANPSSLPT